MLHAHVGVLSDLPLPPSPKREGSLRRLRLETAPKRGRRRGQAFCVIKCLALLRRCRRRDALRSPRLCPHPPCPYQPPPFLPPAVCMCVCVGCWMSGYRLHRLHRLPPPLLPAPLSFPDSPLPPSAFTAKMSSRGAFETQLAHTTGTGESGRRKGEDIAGETGWRGGGGGVLRCKDERTFGERGVAEEKKQKTQGESGEARFST